MSKEKEFLDCADIMRLIGVKKDKAWQIIRNLNKELKEKNYITVRGRVPRKYLLERFGIE